MNFIDATVEVNGDKVTIKFGSFEIVVPESKVNASKIKDYNGKAVTLGIRPENLYDDPDFLAAATTGVLECHVEVTEMMGAETYLYLTCDGAPITARVDPKTTARVGDTIKVAADINKIHVFDKDTEQTIFN